MSREDDARNGSPPRQHRRHSGIELLDRIPLVQQTVEPVMEQAVQMVSVPKCRRG